MNISNAEVERLAVAKREEDLRSVLEDDIWPNVSPEAARRWSKDEEDAAPGYGEFGEPV